MSNKKLRNRTVKPEPRIENPVDQSPEDNHSKAKRLLFYLRSHLVLTIIIGMVTVGALGSVLKYLDDDAQRQIALRNSSTRLNDKMEQSFLNKINPFLPAPDPTPAPHLTKSYIYAGSELLAVEDPGATAPIPPDLAIWRPSSGYWWVMGPGGSVLAQTGWGLSGDIPVAGDYDGDGKTDFAVFRPSTGTWWIIKSGDGNYFSLQFGISTDQPAQADYDGDGKTDIAYYRPSNGTWYVNQSSNGATVLGQFGISTDKPTPKDFDGDGKADLAVWRDTNKTFYSMNSSNNQIQYGIFNPSTGSDPVPADYDGDGKSDFAVRNGAVWVIRNSSTGQTQTINWQAGDVAVQNDYDGDGKVDIAVWAASNGNWYIRKSGSNGALRQEAWGMNGDIPVPVFYKR